MASTSAPPASAPSASGAAGTTSTTSAPSAPSTTVAPSAPSAPTSAPAQTVSIDPALADLGGDDDHDSAYDSELASYTTSIATSVTAYKEYAGRRFHAYKEGSYIFPNDEKEQDRLDITHKMIEVAFGTSWRAPVKNPKRVLDLGTGTGIWALEYADHHPEADVLGNDLSPVQPRWVPTNVRFEVDDIEAQWTYSDKFDYIHCRALYGGIKDWPKLVGQVYENLAPGAWGEFVDFKISMQSPDGTCGTDTTFGQFNHTVVTLAQEMNQDMDPGPKLEGWARDAGFEEISVKRCPLPVGTWAKDKHLKEVGAWMYLQTVEGLESFGAYVFSVKLGWTKEEVAVFCAKVRADLKNPKIHGMLEVFSVIGRKPEA